MGELPAMQNEGLFRETCIELDFCPSRFDTVFVY